MGKQHHYVYGSGSVGCLYDYGPNVAETLDQAIEGLLCVFGECISDEEETELRADLADHGIHYFRDRGEAGADYCEVSREPGPCPEHDE